MRFLLILLSVFSFCPLSVSVGAEGGKKGVQITFLPPPIENASYSLGIYEAKSGKLVRRLHEGATEEAFTAGLNGLITNWDSKDDAGKTVPAGRYAARGYAVGALKVEGKDILGNDWAADDDHLRINSVLAIALVPEDEGLAMVAITPDLHLQAARYTAGEKNELRWQRIDSRLDPKAVFTLPNIQLGVTANALILGPSPTEFAYRLADGAQTTATPTDTYAITDGHTSAGKDRTVWKIEEGVLSQYSAEGERLRSLAPKLGEPVPVAVAASKTADRLYLLEEKKDWQRVRGLSWKETAHEGEKTISTWETFFERSIRTPEALVDAHGAVAPLEIGLVKNPLDPGKGQKVRLEAEVDAKGSYLATADGLHLRRISQSEGLKLARLAKGQAAGSLSFYQSDGAAWDEFSIEGADQMMSFDAGEIEMTATGEKPVAKAAEPDL